MAGSEKIKEDLLRESIEVLENDLLERFDPKRGFWEGRQWMSPAVSAEFLILCKYTDYDDENLIRGIISEVLSRQNEDGGFPAYFGGPSELSLSCICHLGLALYADQCSFDSLDRSKAFIESEGGLRKAMLLAKFYNFIFGKFPVGSLPEMRPELNIIPNWAGFSVYNMASWVRSWIVPLSVVWHRKKYRNYKFWIKPYFPFLRKWGLRIAKKWILDHQQSDGSWYSVFHSTMMCMLALKSLGYSYAEDEMKMGMQFILSLQDHQNDKIRQQPFTGPVWDTALALTALDKNKGKHWEAASAYLKKKQNFIRGDWSKNNASPGGGWGFEDVNEYYPDVDTTAAVLKAIWKNTEDKTDLDKGVKWLLSMQNSNGSWAAFDKNNNHAIIEWYLHFRKYNIGKGKGLILDRGTADLTAHVLETLGSMGFDKSDPKISKAISWLRSNQKSDGSWFGRWGLCYIYGTGAVLQALNAVGEDMQHGYIKKAIAFLKRHQNTDGGFGERPESYHDPLFIGKGQSTLTQTAWGISGLIAAGENNSPHVEKGITYLIENINNGNHRSEKEFQAVAAPPLYQRYELYPYYFPLMTLRAFIG